MFPFQILTKQRKKLRMKESWKEKITNLLCEGCLGEQAFWFYDDQKCDVLESFGSSSGYSGYSWMMARKRVKVGQPIDHKHGSNLNTAYGQAEAWKKIKKMDPEIIFISNPSPQSARKIIFRFCFDVITWQCRRNKKFIVTCPEGSYFLLFLDQKRWHKILSKHLRWERVDLHIFAIVKMRFETWLYITLMMITNKTVHGLNTWRRKMFSAMKYVGRIHTGSIFLHVFLQDWGELLQKCQRGMWVTRDKNFSWKAYLKILTMDCFVELACIMRDIDEHSLLLGDLDMRRNDIPVPLRHILPQKFSTPSLVSTLRMIEALPLGTEVSVRESTNEKIVALIPGLQNIRRMTLQRMYFESCSIFCGTYGRVNPLFSLPDDSVILLWNPGSYHRIFFYVHVTVVSK